MNASRSVTAASVALLALLFTGCAGGAATTEGGAKSDKAEKPAATAQTKEEACDIMLTELSGLQSLSSVDTSDPNAALQAFKDAQAKVGDAALEVSNDEVKPSADDTAAALKGYVEFLEQASADPVNADMSKMSEHVQSLTDSVTELSTVCA